MHCSNCSQLMTQSHLPRIVTFQKHVYCTLLNQRQIFQLHVLSLSIKAQREVAEAVAEAVA